MPHASTLTPADTSLLGLTTELPDTLRAAFAPVPDAAAAEAYTRQLTHSHYENFSVVSILLPKNLRQDFCNVYAFCRIADDLGDELHDPQKSLAALATFRQHLHTCYPPNHPLTMSPCHPVSPAPPSNTAVFLALRQTITRHNIPQKPFDDLISAFEQDQTLTHYATFDQLVDYCTKSADPVGRLVLYMCGYRDEERQRLSDKTCTALQLINFWQDVRRDILERNRIYIPAEDLARFQVTESQLRQGALTNNFRQLLQFQVERTEKFFSEGDHLLPLLAPQFRKQIALFSKGGRAIATAIRRQNFDTLTKRPRLSKWQKTKLIASTLLGGA